MTWRAPEREGKCGGLYRAGAVGFEAGLTQRREGAKQRGKDLMAWGWGVDGVGDRGGASRLAGGMIAWVMARVGGDGQTKNGWKVRGGV